MGMTEERARRFLEERVITDAKGQVELGSFPGEQVVVAVRGEERSMPWRGEASLQGGSRGDIILRLAGGFTIGGRISLPDWTHLGYEGERRLIVTAQTGSLVRSLFSLRSVKGGTFGPISLPIEEDARYRIRLEGSPIIPAQREFDAPDPGSHLDFQLTAELGYEAWFFAVNEADETLFEAEALVRFFQDGRENFVRRRTRPDGYINPWSFPAGTIVATITAPGYAPRFLNPFTLPESQPGAHRVVLEKGRQLRGRCLHAGIPIESFQVVLWQPEVLDSQQTQDFFGRVDGRFELENVPSVDVLIAASSESLAPCEPVVLQAFSSSEEEILLELPSPLIGSGQVVDAETGEAISTAELQLLISAANAPVAPWGPPRRVAPDGSFQIAGFAPGQNFVRCRAPSYADALVQAAGTAGREIDLGQIRLSRPQKLEVQLTGAPTGFDYATFEVYPLDDKAFARRRFSSTGVLEVDDIHAGRIDLMILPTSDTYRRMVLDLRPREEWRHTHRVAGPRQVTVEVFAGDEAPPQFDGVFVQYIDAAGVPTMLGSKVSVGVPIVFEGIEAEEVNVELADVAGQTLAASTGSFGGENELYVPIHLGGKPLRVVVVDPDGEPLPGTRVTVQDSEASPVSVSAVTGGDGVCEVRGIPRRAVLVNLVHSTRGSRYGIPCDARQEEVELVLSGEATIALRLVDGEVPLADVSCRFVGMSGLPLSPVTNSQPDGSVRWEGLTAGRYRLSARRGDCWPLLTEVEATERADRKDVQIRRLGSLVFRVRDRTGLPVSGQRIELTSGEFDVDVSDWLEQGSVSGASGLVSDLRGEIGLEGLPRGPYRWRFTAPAGDSFDGVIEVPASEQTIVPLILP